MLGYDSICIHGRTFKLISCNEVVRFWYWVILAIKLRALVKHKTKNLKLLISSTALHVANRFFYISLLYGRVQLLYFHLLEKVLPWMKRLSSSCLEERLHKSVRVECTHLSGLLFAYGPAQLSWPPFPFLSDFSVYSSRSCVIFRHDHLLFSVCVPIEVSRLSALIQKSVEDRISFHTLEARKQTSAPPWCRFTVRYSHAQTIRGDALILSFLWSIFMWPRC